MSGLYNMIMGIDPMAPILLAILRLPLPKVPRFRDCWWDGTHIVVHTRTGGGNRMFYESPEQLKQEYPEEDYSGPFNADLRRLATFVRDEDEPFDSTYANFYYSMPTNFQWVVPKLVVQGKTASTRWQEVFDRMKAGTETPREKLAVAELAELLRQVFDQNDKEHGNGWKQG